MENDKLEILTVADVLQRGAAETKRLARLNRWKLSETGYELELKDGDYWIPLADITTSAQMLDWIFQIRGKSWGDAKTLADLLWWFRLLFDPQATLCRGGYECGPRTFTLCPADFGDLDDPDE